MHSRLDHPARLEPRPARRLWWVKVALDIIVGAEARIGEDEAHARRLGRDIALVV